MTVEGYFDGTAVRTLEPVDLKPNQKVFIQIPEQKKQMTKEKLSKLLESFQESHLEDEKFRKKEQKKAVDDLFNLLTDDEAAAFGKAMEEPLHFKTVEL